MKKKQVNGSSSLTKFLPAKKVGGEGEHSLAKDADDEEETVSAASSLTKSLTANKIFKEEDPQTLAHISELEIEKSDEVITRV